MPLQNEAINPIDESNFSASGQVPVTPNVPVDIDNIDPMAFSQNPGQMVIPNAQPIHFDEKPVLGKPGFFKTFAHAAWDYNELVNAGRFVARTADNISHLQDDRPDNWEAATMEAIEGYDEKYWPYIWDAVSPKDQQARQEEVRSQMKDAEYYHNGSMLANLGGALVGGIASPSTWLIPAAAGVKYAKFGENLVKNVWTALPSASLSAVAVEGAYQAGHAGGNVQDWAIDSLRDIVFGAALIGGAAGLGSVVRGGELYAMKKTTNFAAKGVDFVPEVNEKGEFVRWKSVASPKMAANAQLVDEAQLFADSTMNKSGLTKYIPHFDFLAGNKITGSPIIRGATSTYLTTRGFIDRLASHGIETVGVSKGIPRPISAEEMLGRTRTEARIFGSAIRGLYYEANGLSRSDNPLNAIKNAKQAITQNKRISFDDFGKAVRGVINTDAPHELTQVNEAAKLAMEFVGKIGKEFTDAHGWDEGFLKPRTAANYLMQNYNLGQIRGRPEDFINLVAEELQKQDAIITRLETPVREAEERLARLQETMISPEFMSETRSIANEIAEAKGNLQREKDNLVRTIEDSEDLHLLTEDRIFLNSQERIQLKEILRPMEELKSKHSDMKAILSQLKEKRSRIKQNIQKNVKEETRKKNQKKLAEAEKKIEFQDSTIKALEDDIEMERLRLLEHANSGKINRKFFTREDDSNLIHFRNPDERPKFRRVHESHADRLAYAQHLRETILGNTPEHLNDAVLGSMVGTAIDSPQYLKSRSVMIPSEVFNSAGFLDPDIGRAMSAYANTMGRHTALRMALGNNVSKPGIQGVLDSLLKEKQKKYKEIIENPDSPERKKALDKHDKEYQKEVRFIKAVYEAYMGRRGDPRVKRYTQSLKNYAAATLLGGVPLSQISDLGAIVLKHGMYDFMMHGLRPMLKSINGMVKGELGEALKENAAHALVAVQHIHGGAFNKFSSPDTMADMPIFGTLGSTLDTLSHVSGNIYGTNYIENLNQTMVANITQSKIMKAAFDYQVGKITEKQIRQMAHLGIDLKKDSEAFIKGFKESNGWEEAGGYQSKYYDWSDVAASNKMAEAIYRSVYDTVVQGGMFTSPLWTHDPIGGMIFTFHGWAYGAFVRYTIPALQRPDAQAAIGAATMFGLGLLIEPLRQWANGKEVDFEKEHFFLKALDNSGILSVPSDTLNTLNMLMGGELIPGMASERRRELSFLGTLGGPAIGQLEIGSKVLRDVWTGKITQSTAKNSARLLGLNQHLLLRRVSNNYLKSTGLPEKRSDAQPWPWWQLLGGQ